MHSEPSMIQRSLGLIDRFHTGRHTGEVMDAAAFVKMNQSLTLCVFALLLFRFILFSFSTKKVAKESSSSLLLSPCCLFRHHFLS